MPDFKFRIHITHEEVITVGARDEARARLLLASLAVLGGLPYEDGDLIQMVETESTAVSVNILELLE